MKSHKLSSSKKSSLLKVAPKELRKRVEPDEWYEAIFTSSEVKKSNFPNNKGADYLQLDFKLTKNEENITEDGNSAEGSQLNAISGLPVKIGNRAYNMIVGILGRELEVDEEIDLAAYYGHKYKIFVEDKETTDDDGLKWQKVSKIKHIAKKKIKDKKEE